MDEGKAGGSMKDEKQRHICLQNFKNATMIIVCHAAKVLSICHELFVKGSMTQRYCLKVFLTCLPLFVMNKKKLLAN